MARATEHERQLQQGGGPSQFSVMPPLMTKAKTSPLGATLMAAPLSMISCQTAIAARGQLPQEAPKIKLALAHDARTCCPGRERVARIRVSSADPAFAAANIEWLDARGRVMQDPGGSG